MALGTDIHSRIDNHVLPNRPLSGRSTYPLSYWFGRTWDIRRYCSSCGEPREIEQSHITRPLTRSCWYEPGLMYDLCLCKAWKPQSCKVQGLHYKDCVTLSIGINYDRYLMCPCEISGQITFLKWNKLSSRFARRPIYLREKWKNQFHIKLNTERQN